MEGEKDTLALFATACRCCNISKELFTQIFAKCQASGNEYFVDEENLYFLFEYIRWDLLAVTASAIDLTKLKTNAERHVLSYCC